MFTQSEYFPDILICLTLWKVFDSRGCFGQAEKFLHFWRTHVSKSIYSLYPESVLQVKVCRPESFHFLGWKVEGRYLCAATREAISSATWEEIDVNPNQLLWDDENRWLYIAREQGKSRNI